MRKKKIDYMNFNGAENVVSNFKIDNRSHMLMVVIEKGLNVKQINISVEQAVLLGIIDFSKLEPYL